MVQTVITYVIVAVAVAWLLWTLFLPASLRERLRGGTQKKAPDCGDGCAACDGCPTASPTPKQHKGDTNRAGRELGRTGR